MSEITACHIPQEIVNDETVTVLQWKVPTGSAVRSGQVLAELETSKTAFDFPAPRAGYVHYTLPVGAEPAIGSLLCYITDTPEKPATADSPTAPPPAEAPASSNGHPHTPTQSPSSSAADPLALDQPIAASPRRADFTTTRFSKRAAALLAERKLDPAAFEKRGLVREQDVLRHLNGERPPSATPGASTATDLALSPGTPGEGGDEGDFERTSELGARNHPHPNPLPGYRERGMERIAGALDRPRSQTAGATPVSHPAAAHAGPVGAAGVAVRDEPLSRAKRTEIKYLASAFQHALPSAVSVAVPTRGLRAAVQSLAPVGGNATAVIAYEAARLLRKYPLFNGYYEDGHAKLYQQVNVGFAVDAGKGLKVPVIRDADTKSIAQVSEEIGQHVFAYLSDALPVETLAGGTFTLTDLSGEGVTYFHPLINRGQSAILGVGAEYFPPGGSDGVFNLILAFDHQLSDGRTAAKFLGELADRLRSYEAAAKDRSAPARPPAELRCSNCQRSLSPSDPHNRFLVPVIMPDGSDGRLCQICFDGWM